jgi:Flp pilus assembly pilin Flp
MKRVHDILRSQGGATSIEYAAIASLISIAAYFTLSAIGSTVVGFFEAVPKF